jgi:hypothetical protein
LVSKFPLQFQQLLEMVNAGMSFFEAESALGLKHTIIGYLLARNWNLPEVFQEGILYHHNPEKSPKHKKVSAIVALADSLAHKVGFEMKMEALDLDLPYILTTIGLKVEDLQTFIKSLMASIPQVQPVWHQMMRVGGKRDNLAKSRFSSLINDTVKSKHPRR